MYPQARQNRVLVQEVGGELVVYDQQRDYAHYLNKTAALIWRHCDGKTSIADLAGLLHTEMNLPAEEDLVWMTLQQLEESRLLATPLVGAPDKSALSRRQMIQKMGLTSKKVILLPLIASLMAPTLAASASGTGSCSSSRCSGACTTASGTAGKCQFVNGTTTCACI